MMFSYKYCITQFVSATPLEIYVNFFNDLYCSTFRIYYAFILVPVMPVDSQTY